MDLRRVRAGTCTALVLAGIAAGPASAAPEKPVPPAKLVFVAAPDGALAPTADESFAGVKAAFHDEKVELTREMPKKAGAWDAFFADLDKRGVALVFAFVDDGETARLEKAAEKAKVPLLVLSPESTQPSLDPDRDVFWAGGLVPTDEALFAMDFLLAPLAVHAPAIYHDGSPRAVEAAGKCAFFHHTSQFPRPPVALPADFGVADVKGVLGAHANAESAAGTSSGSGADGILYFGGPAGAERLASACADAKVTAPVLLAQGLATRAVPSFAEGRAASAWALESQYIEDYVDGKGSPAAADAPRLAEVAKETGGRLYAATIRGYRVGRWIADALRRAAESPEKRADKKLRSALRETARECARGRRVFEDWGHASLARFEGWAAKYMKEPPCTRVKPTYMPIAAMPQIGFFSGEKYRWEPGSNYCWLYWGKDEERTIEKDLAALGLDPGKYEEGFRKQLLDDLLGRTISRLNRLFRRNADGTAIPGVSFNITFGTEKEPKGLKGGHRFEMVLRGDDPVAGGRAHGTTCEVFTTFIRRTMYQERALKPPLAREDLEYVNGTYRWGTKLERNLRSDGIRSLLDGYTQAFGLTGAHECGHMFGCGHDEKSPRSIMNVAEAVGLDFEWAEWIPDHLATIEQRLGRVAADGERPRK
jgi:hypothetical protein